MTLLLILALLTQDSAKADVVSKLNATRVTVDFKDASLAEALEYLREASGLQFHVDADVDARVTFAAKDLPVRTVLKLMLRGADLGVVYRDGVLVVRKQADARAPHTLEMYDVRALLARLDDFPGPRVDLRPQLIGHGSG